jgi:acyl-CoA synthetase (AMP-forming)/AMP-acid ligase II
VALALPNGAEMAAAFLATVSCAVCAPLNPAYRESELQSALVGLRCRAVIVPAGEESPAAAAARACGLEVITLSAHPEAGAGRFRLCGPDAPAPARAGLPASEETALLLQTSGTTSRPKTVPLSHANLLSATRSIAQVLELGPHDRSLLIMPLFHIHGLSALLATLASGGSAVCAPGFYANRFYEWLAQFRPTWYTAAPTMHQSILERAKLHAEVIRQTSLRFVRSASAPMPPTLIAEVESTLGVPLIEAYGMTEASPQISSNPLPPRTRKPGSVGLPAGPEVAILDESGRRLPAGQAGEVAIRGANVMTGYENGPEENARAFAGGWLRTGDQGYLDEHGYLFITGRLKELINRGGEKISPREVEEVLVCHPAVAVAGSVKHCAKSVPTRSSRDLPVASSMAMFRSATRPFRSMATNGSRLASMRCRV